MHTRRWGASPDPSGIAALSTPVQAGEKRRLPSTGRCLLALTLACSLPLLLLGAVLGFAHLEADSKATDTALLTRAMATSRAVSLEIETRRLALAGFGAVLAGMDRSDLAAMDAAARRLAETLGSPVTLLDRGLGMMVDTAEPFGTPLGSTPAVAAGLWVVETGRPRVSDLTTNGAGTALLLVPVMQDGRTVMVLSAALQPERLAAAIAVGPATIFDNRWRPVAGQADTALPAPNAPVLAAAARGQVQAGRSAIGASLRFVVVHLAEAPEWQLVVWEPTGPVAAGIEEMAVEIGLALAVILLLTTAMLLRTRRRLRTPFLELQRQIGERTRALLADSPPPPLHPVGGTAEFANLSVALQQADQAASAHERRMRALAEAGAIVLWRADVAGGWNEAAGWAGLTGQTAPSFHGDGWLEMLHPDDRAPTLAEWGRSLVARSPIGVEFRLRTANAGADWRWVRATGVPVADEAGHLLEWVGAIHDVTDPRGAGMARQVNDSQVRQTIAELRAIYDNVPVGLSLVDASLRFVNVNERFAALTGLPPAAHIGHPPHEVMPEGLARPLEDAQQRAFETGRPVLDVTCSGPVSSGSPLLRYWLASCHPVRDADGTVTGVSSVLQDVTERVRAERSREMLVTELNHRVKNTLATVQSLAAQSLRSSRGSANGLGREFVGRLQALMRAHDLLSDQGWRDIDLTRVIRTGLDPWIENGRPIRFGGSGRIQITSGQTQALVLALHELGTNAVLHGALSQPGGEVAVQWSLGEDGVTTIDWQESGGPAVAPPAPESRGFGLRLLERGLAHDLGPHAEVDVAFTPGGLHVQMRFRAGVPVFQHADEV